MRSGQKWNIMTSTAKTGTARARKPAAEPVLLNLNGAAEKVRELQKFLDANVINQPGLNAAACNAYAQALNGLREKTRPIYVVFALGYKGTGKSLTPKKLAKFIHGNEKALIMVNCGGYSEKHMVARLSGSPPGYVKSDDPNAAKLFIPAFSRKLDHYTQRLVILCPPLDAANPAFPRGCHAFHHVDRADVPTAGIPAAGIDRGTEWGMNGSFPQFSVGSPSEP